MDPAPEIRYGTLWHRSAANLCVLDTQGILWWLQEGADRGVYKTMQEGSCVLVHVIGSKLKPGLHVVAVEEIRNGHDESKKS